MEGLKIPRKCWEGTGFLLLWGLKQSCCRFAQSLQWGQSRGRVCSAIGAQNTTILWFLISLLTEGYSSNTVKFLLNRRLVTGSDQKVKNKFSRENVPKLQAGSERNIQAWNRQRWQRAQMAPCAQWARAVPGQPSAGPVPAEKGWQRGSPGLAGAGAAGHCSAD